MTKDLEEFFNHKRELKQRLLNVLPQEAVDYIIELVVKDLAHRKYIRFIDNLEQDDNTLS